MYVIIMLSDQDVSNVALRADASGVHASTIVVDRVGTPSPVGRLASMPVENAPGGCGRKTDVVS